MFKLTYVTITPCRLPFQYNLICIWKFKCLKFLQLLVACPVIVVLEAANRKVFWKTDISKMLRNRER